jgi:hypothetical protein
MINLERSELFDFKGQTVVTPWDRIKKHIFPSYPVHTSERIMDLDNLLETATGYADQADMVWIVDENAKIRSDFPWHYRPSDIGRTLVHEFPRVTKRTKTPVIWGDVRLVPTSGSAREIVKNKLYSGFHEADFDMVMLSYFEAEADEKYQKLKNRFPDIKHVKNVKGIGAAHKKAAEISKTDMVWIIDADSDVLPSFGFDFNPPMANRKNTTYSWFARNPINGLEYGYGGIKLFPRQQLLEMGHELPDFSTGSAFYQPVSDVASITSFNKDPFRTWRSAFRECVKLSSGINPNNPQQETIDRLETWCTVDNGARFGRYSIKGAVEGRAYGEEHKDDVDALNKINDFEWLREQFVASMKKQIRTDD